ncbi:hypothetical protein D3C78_1957840 [compost metagenome]
MQYPRTIAAIHHGLEIELQLPLAQGPVQQLMPGMALVAHAGRIALGQAGPGPLRLAFRPGQGLVGQAQ